MAPAKDKDQIEMEGVVFDPDRCVACNVEHGHTVAHGSGGRGYGLASTPMTSGCYQWKVSFLLLIFLTTKRQQEEENTYKRTEGREWTYVRKQEQGMKSWHQLVVNKLCVVKVTFHVRENVWWQYYQVVLMVLIFVVLSAVNENVDMSFTSQIFM